MIPVMQRQTHAEDAAGNITVSGDCFLAAVASILELPYEDVPHFMELYKDSLDDWPAAFQSWANERGFWVLIYQLNNKDFQEDSWIPLGYWIATVKTPRFQSGTHAVVMQGHTLVHDPHPGPHRGEHRGFTGAYVFVHLDPAPAPAPEPEKV